MTHAEFRLVVFDAARGLDAINQFIETRFKLADELEADGDREEAEEIRKVWTGVWEALADAPRRSILAELHTLMDPEVFDEAHALVNGA